MQRSDPSSSQQQLAQTVVDHMVAEDRFSAHLGMEVLAVGPGYAKVQLTVQPHMVSGVGLCHGGITFSLADSAFAFACNSHNQRSVALTLTIQYIKGVHIGDVLTAVAEEKAITTKTGAYTVHITNQHGTLVALFNATAYRTDKPLVQTPSA